MSNITLKYDKYDVCRTIAMKYGRTVVDDTIIVPDVKPDIRKVLDVSARAYITDITPAQDKVHIEGTAKATLLYIPDGDVIGNIKSLSMSREFSHTMEVKGADADSVVTGEAEVDTVDNTLINSRKVNIRLGINIGVKLCKNETMEIPVDILNPPADTRPSTELLDILPFKKRNAEPETDVLPCKAKIELKKMPLRLIDRQLNTEGSMILRDQYEVPSKLPVVGEVLLTNISVEPEEAVTTNGNTRLKGNLKVNIMYEDAQDGTDENAKKSAVRTAEFNIPYSEQFDTPNAVDDMECEPEFTVREVYTEVRDNMDGEAKLIGIEAVIGVNISEYCIAEPMVITDAYSLSGDDVNLEFSETAPEQPVDTKTTQITHKSTAKRLAATQPEILGICCVNILKTSVDDIKIENNSVIIKGNILSKIVYLSNDENQPISSIQHKTDFEHKFDSENLSGKKLACDAKIFINHVGYTISGSDAVDLRFIIGISLKLIKSDPIKSVKSIELTETEESQKNNVKCYIIYFVQGGDTLWNIAKRYHTTVDEIVKANNIANPDKINIGQKIKIVTQ